MSKHELLRTELQLWAISQGASTWLVDLEPYEPSQVAGIAVRWRIDPVDGFIELTLADGTGELVARWPSSRRLSPVHPYRQATGLVLEGIPSIGPEGDLVMIDPEFQRVDFPAVG